jgi:glycosyltransferase involved in cell wall biosynthesis
MSQDRQKPKVSIVTVVLNSHKLIAQTLESVLNQTYSDIEYIVIDGGSSDGTRDIIQQYGDKIQQIIFEPDNGIYDAMNKSLKFASGDFILFMNAGDTFVSNLIVAEAVEKIKDRNSVYYGNALSYSSGGTLETYKNKAFSKFRLAKTNICHQTIFYPREIFKKNEFDLKYKLYSDWEYNMRLFRKVKFNYLDMNIAVYDMKGLTSFNRDIVFKNDQILLIFKHLGADVIAVLIISKIYKTILEYLKLSKKAF